MSRSRAELIDGLAAELAPVRGPGRTSVMLVTWLGVSWIFVTTLILATGPMRPGVVDQLLGSPRFLLESFGGLAAGVLTIFAALRLGIPGPAPLAHRAAPPLLMLGAWILAYVYGLWDPSLELSMLGKREECYLQVFLYGGPPLGLGLFMLRRLAPFSRVATGMLLGAAAGAIPALLMQMACMYIPEHILTAHIGPNGVLALVGALAGPLVMRRV